MKHVWKMLMAALLVCMLLLPAGAVAEDKMYGEANQDKVPAMNTNSTTGYEVFTLDKGYDFEIVEPIFEGGAVAWYKVWCVRPADGVTYQVYIQAKYVDIISADEYEDPKENAPSDKDDEDPKEEVTMKPSVDDPLGGDDKVDVVEVKAKAKSALNVGVYDEPSTSGKLVITIPANTVVDVTGMIAGERGWYRVSYNGKTGFVPNSMLQLVGSEEDKEDALPAVGKGVTQNTNGVNLRTAPSTSSESQGKLVSGIEVELLSIPEKIDSNHWFMVRYDGKVGYIQAPYIKVLGGSTGGDEDNKVVEIGLIVNTTGVNVREKADKNSTSLGKLTAGDYIEVLKVPEKFDVNHWFKVLYEGKVGYIQAPYVRVPSMDGEDEEDDPTDTPTDAPLYTIEGVIQNTNGVNFGEKADKSSTSMAQLKAGTKVTVVFPLPEKFTEKYWFQVIYNGKTGYIQAPYVKIAGITDKPTDAPSDEPTLKPEDEPMIGIGLIQNTDGVNFREKADVSSTSMAQLKAGTLVDVIKAPTVNDTKHWFRVRYNGKVGYIQAPYVYLPGWVFTGEEDEPTETPETDVVADGVIQNTNGVNFRKAASTAADSMGLLKAGVKVAILEIPKEINTSNWFKVRYDGKVGYIQAPYVRVLAAGEDPDKPTSTPEWDDDVVGLGLITSTNGVNFREGPSIHYDSLGKLSAGMQVYLLKIPSGTDSDNWFKIRYNGKDGYIQAPYVVVLQGEIPDEEGINGAIGVGVVTSTNGVNFRTGPSKEYGTMGKIPFDTAVDLLSAPSVVDEDHWYKVAYNGKTGYVQAPFIRVVTINAGALPDVSVYGYAKLIQSTANLRDSASGNTVVTWKGKDSLLRIAGESVTSGYYEWIPVFYPADSAIYYVRADMVQIVMVENGQIVTPTPAPASRYGYVLTTGQNVNLRIQPDEESIAKIPKGTVLVCVDDPIDPWNSDYTWYKVVYNGMYGYVRGDYVTVCDRNGTPLEDEDDPDDSDEPITILGYIRVKALKAGNRVNLRDTQAGTRIGLLDDGLILPVIEAKTAAGVYGQYGWYKVKTADGLVGYVRDDCAVACDKNGNAIETPDVPSEEVVSGYVMVTGNNVYVRQSPFGVGLGNVATSTIWPIVGETKVSSGITWYNIKAIDVTTGKEITGYIHGDYVYKLTDAEAKKYEADPTYRPNVSDKPVVDTNANYVITVNTNGLNLRASYSQDSNSLYQVKSGVVMEYIGTKQVGTVTWYNVIYKDIELWAHGNYLQVMTTEEYKAYLAQNPDFEPNVADKLGYVRTIVKNAPVLNAADGSKTIATIESKHLVLKYYTEKISAGGEYWYRVYVDKDKKFGYINAGDVERCDASGEPLKPEVTDAEKTQQETTYSTLKKGSSGDAVANLVQELINQGYYKGKVTSSFTTAVKEAVEMFQEVHGLDVDGIADSATQHALFGTVPIGAGDTNNLYFPIYKVEKIDWFDGGIQQMIPRGANFKIYDVKTGIVWWAHRWAGSFHADIETLTKADSKRLCQIYGVSNLQEIVDKNLWQRRPCLVTIGTRTFACSLDGMQHNPDGDTIGNNGMDGQICLHFTNSKGHSSGAVSDSHSEAIQYAYTYDYTGRPGYMGK